MKVDLDRRENLDGFQKLVSTIEISRSRSRYLDLVSTGIAKTVLLDRDRDLSRLIEILVIFCDFCGFLDFFLDLDREIVYFYKYLDRDFSSQPYLFTFCASKLASKWAKSAGNSNFFQKVSTNLDLSRQNLDLSRQNLDYLQISRKISFCLDLSRKSRLVSTISIKISTHLYLD